MTVDFGRPPMFGFTALDKAYAEIGREEQKQIDKDIIQHILDEDVFYGGGFVDGPNVPVQACINDVIWYGANEQEELEFEYNEFYNKPIC